MERMFDCVTAWHMCRHDDKERILTGDQRPLLDLIVKQLGALPELMRIVVTSREEPLIQHALAKFKPKELRADETKNLSDVRIFCYLIADQ